jgi:hypothetical protein
MKINSKKMSLIILFVFIFTITISISLGIWTNDKTAIHQSGKDVKLIKGNTGSENEEEHEESGISGQTSFDDLLKTGITEKEIEKILGIKIPDNKSITIRDYCFENGKSFGPVKQKLESLLK